MGIDEFTCPCWLAFICNVATVVTASRALGEKAAARIGCSIKVLPHYALIYRTASYNFIVFC